MNATPGFRYLAWLTAVCAAGFFAAGAFRFGSRIEPERTDFPALLILLGLGLASQIGLVAAPWSLSRSSSVRVIVAILMAPAAIILGLAAWNGTTRFVAGNPISPLAWTLYVAGALVYGLAYAELAWRRVHQGRRL